MQPTQNPTVEVAQTPAGTLRCAALYLKRHGLHRGEMFATLRPGVPTPAACVQGAVKMAICGGVNVAWSTEQALLFDHTISVLADHLRNQYSLWTPEEFADDPATLVAEWNDRIAANLDEVLTALSALADSCERQHPGGAQ